MRRAFSLLLFTVSAALLAISSVSLSASPAQLQVTLPGTNTPLPLVFATNTIAPTRLTHAQPKRSRPA